MKEETYSYLTKCYDDTKISIDKNMPEAALNCVRRGVEAIVCTICTDKGIPIFHADGKEIDLFELMIEIEKEQLAEEDLLYLFHRIRSFGNRGSHYDRRRSAPVSMADAKYIYDLFSKVISKLNINICAPPPEYDLYRSQCKSVSAKHFSPEQSHPNSLSRLKDRYQENVLARVNSYRVGHPLRDQNQRNMEIDDRALLDFYIHSAAARDRKQAKSKLTYEELATLDDFIFTEEDLTALESNAAKEAKAVIVAYKKSSKGAKNFLKTAFISLIVAIISFGLFLLAEKGLFEQFQLLEVTLLFGAAVALIAGVVFIISLILALLSMVPARIAEGSKDRLQAEIFIDLAEEKAIRDTVR